jgi:hypothetical protein
MACDTLGECYDPQGSCGIGCCKLGSSECRDVAALLAGAASENPVTSALTGCSCVSAGDCNQGLPCTLAADLCARAPSLCIPDGKTPPKGWPAGVCLDPSKLPAAAGG